MHDATTPPPILVSTSSSRFVLGCAGRGALSTPPLATVALGATLELSVAAKGHAAASLRRFHAFITFSLTPARWHVTFSHDAAPPGVSGISSRDYRRRVDSHVAHPRTGGRAPLTNRWYIAGTVYRGSAAGTPRVRRASEHCSSTITLLISRPLTTLKARGSERGLLDWTPS